MKPEVVSPSRIPRQLLERYHRSGPRYTSYPTAPQFKAGFDAAVVRERWRSTNPAGGGLSLYVHVPFCRSRCLYCGCHTEVGRDRETAEKYADALLSEARHVASLLESPRPVRQVAIGGGTPVFLTQRQMRRLVEGLGSVFLFDPQREQSIEIDPRRVDRDYLETLLELGFSRFSFGVQDLDPEVQRKVRRIMPAERIQELLAHLRSSGIDAINIDLIYGLPGQTSRSFSRTIERVIELRPSRLALFGYAHVPWVSPHQRALEQYHLPTPEERMSIFGMAYEKLLEAGYAHVGMDHFARPDDELIRALETRSLTRNFMGYTTRRGLDLVGLGGSSISSVDGTYVQNCKGTEEYVSRAPQGAWAKGLILTPEDELRRQLILDLFCNFHVHIPSLERRFGIDFHAHFAPEVAALTPLQTDGLLEVGADSISVTPLGRFFIRNICMCFDQYLPVSGAETRYSKTM